jgi:GNAT superfamily N-acetyltransferase
MPALRYAVERWATYAPDAEKLWPLHWEEIALDQSVIPLDVDMDRYASLDAAGQLHIVTARDEGGVLHGYVLYVVMPHLHYKSTLHGFMDVLYLSPVQRKGLAGYRLLQMAEKTLRERGVKKVLMGGKRHYDLAPLYERLGYTEIERHFSKLLL